ncbi:hypothetical protein [Deferrisoma camini]|uniref:hypothetical protein n=1 Tax=Deferrisoma camini TaxID=1035120 RepID=UPI00146B82DE|nr:hypothetical protein [Deferrisoma camini]
MEEIIIPKNTGTDHTELPPGYQRYVIPDSLQEQDRLKLFGEQINAVINKQIEIEKIIQQYKAQVDEYAKELKIQTNRNMEVIGVFSSIIALLIIDVNIIKSAQTFLSSILLIIALTCCVAIFSIMIHSFFSEEPSKKFNKHFWIPALILSLLLCYGIAVETGFLKNEKQQQLENISKYRDSKKIEIKK